MDGEGADKNKIRVLKICMEISRNLTGKIGDITQQSHQNLILRQLRGGEATWIHGTFS